MTKGTKKLDYNADFVNSEIQNVKAQILSSDPGSPEEGQFWYNSTGEVLKYRTSSTSVSLGSGSGDVTGPASSTAGQGAVFSDTTGKDIEALTATGVLKAASGVISAATAGTDYTTPASTETFTNKTIDANGTGNSISNLEVADLASGVLNVSATLTSASDSQVPSALAVKTYADNLLGNNDAFTYQGGIDASTNPNYPAADAGDTYKITAAGKIGGASGADVTVGDTLYCTVDSSASGDHATVGANWTIVQANVDAATTTTQGLVELATQAEAEARTDTARAVTPASIANFPVKYAADIGNGLLTDITVTHNLGTKDITYSIRQNSDDAFIDCAVVATSTTTATFSFSTAPTSNQYRVVIHG